MFQLIVKKLKKIVDKIKIGIAHYRPKSLSDSRTPLIEVFKYVVEKYRKKMSYTMRFGFKSMFSINKKDRFKKIFLFFLKNKKIILFYLFVNIHHLFNGHSK